MQGEPFVPGQVLGGVRVLDLLHEGRSQDTTRYLVARTCCGELLELTHHRIYQRESVGNRRCRPCRYAGVDPMQDKSEHRGDRGVLIRSGNMRGWWPSLTPMGFRGV